jgi:protein TonB
MRGPVKIINRKNELKQGYLIRVELGIMLSLLIVITAAKVDIKAEKDGDVISINKQEEVFMEEIVQTKQEQKAPPPPRPVIPIEVPNDEILEDEIIDLDAELDLGASVMELPPPPPREIEQEDEEEIFVVVEQMPELIGGLGAVQKLITYPDMAIKAGIEGKVIVQFIIDKDGNVVDPFVIRGIGGGCDKEALKAVSKAKFIPGRQRGKPVMVRFSVPVSFRLDTGS